MIGLRSTGGAALLTVLLILTSGAVGAAARPRTAAATTATASATLIYGSTDEPDTLNPWTTLQGNGNPLAPAIFDSLLRVDARGRPQPELAASVQHTPDGRTWTFHLRHGVRWADGQPFTSADVVYNYRAIFDKTHNVAAGVTGWDLIDRYSTPDAYTFVCHLKAVSAPFLANVGWALLVPQHVYDRPGVDFNKTPFNRAPFGTGPYRVTEWQAGDHITLTPNPYSWRGRPFFQKIIDKIVPDSNTLLVQLRTGAVDMGSILQRQAGQASAVGGKRLVTWLNNGYSYVGLTQWGFLRETVVRQALDYATPRQAIFNGISKGLGAIAYSNISPAVTDYYDARVPRRAFDLTRAAALLAADGFVKGADGVLQKNGQPLAIALWAASSDANGQLTNQVLQQEWGRIGVKVTLRTVDGNALFSPGGPYFTQAMAGVTAVNDNNPDPDDSLNWISAGIPRSPTDATCCNTFAYFHRFDFQAQIDALYQAGNSTLDAARRRAIYLKIQALLADRVPVIFLYWTPELMLMPADLKGFVGNPFYPVLNEVASWQRG